MPSIKTLHNDVFHALDGLYPRNSYGPICLTKLFKLCLSTSTFPS
ncbi:hypothetical protein E2C01_097998 [Portunus trituberculatus]|uniref:Uncharacterized protein n=1 Tax=Portunus trituberculatus TaxID=210409 RepID=A0A5B7KBR5_PORTR|nr:hypothetical protein [Portunus trituberculatus]